VKSVSADRATIKQLFVEGTPFVLFGAVMVLTPNVDAMYLSQFAPPEVMGWFAAMRRLLGVLLLPASALIGALYPTLCRLHATDTDGFKSATRGTLQSVSLVVVPVALGCGLYPDIGVSIFSASFEPAEDNLRIMSLFLFLVYFSMPLGTAIMAAGRQRVWSLVLGMCVVVSLVLDPILVPWFQKRTGNGGLGLCVAGVVSEVLVVSAGLFLIPKGIIDKRLGRSILLALVSGMAMAGVAYATRSITPFVAAPLAVMAYGIALFVTGAIEKDQIAAIQGAISRRLARFKRAG
jgi:O-antigen/teichoic acid export membrane protein